MNDIGLDPTESEDVGYDVSDDALEAAAWNESLAAGTMFCSGIQCPG